MKIILKEELAWQWCRFNDKNSFYHNAPKTWNKDKIAGAMHVIELFVEEKELKKAWKKYHNAIRLQKRILGA
jgi:hypothetical protein